MSGAVIVVTGEGGGFRIVVPEFGHPDGVAGVLARLRAVALTSFQHSTEFRSGVVAVKASRVFRDDGKLTAGLRGGDPALAMFRYRVSESWGAKGALYVAVDGRVVPGGGRGRWRPLAAFLVFPERVRAVKLAQADQTKARGLTAYQPCVEAVLRAVESAPPIVGDDFKGDWDAMADSLRRVAGFVGRTGLLEGGPHGEAALLARAASCELRAAGSVRKFMH